MCEAPFFCNCCRLRGLFGRPGKDIFGLAGTHPLNTRRRAPGEAAAWKRAQRAKGLVVEKTPAFLAALQETHIINRRMDETEHCCLHVDHRLSSPQILRSRLWHEHRLKVRGSTGHTNLR